MVSIARPPVWAAHVQLPNKVAQIVYYLMRANVKTLSGMVLYLFMIAWCAQSMAVQRARAVSRSCGDWSKPHG